MRRPLHLPQRHGVSRVLGGAAVGHHLLRQLRPGHAHSLPVHHARGMDRHALLGTWTGSRTINSVHQCQFKELLANFLSLRII